MKKIISLLLFISLYILECNAQNTSIIYDADNSSVTVTTSFDQSMSYCHGYDAGHLQVLMIDRGDTCCLYCSIGITQISSSLTEQASDVNIYCWPRYDTVYEQFTCEDQPRFNREDAELVINFHLEAEDSLRCTVSFYPEKCADSYNYDVDSLLNYPHYYVDNLYEIVCGMLCQGKCKKDVESFIDTFDKRLDPSLLDMDKGYGVDYGEYRGYDYHKYTYYLLKALLHISNNPYTVKDIIELNKELNRFYKVMYDEKEKCVVYH